MKIKDYYLSLLNENEDFFYVDDKSISKIKDVSISKKNDSIKIDFETSYGKLASLTTQYSTFKKWYSNNIDKFQNVFKTFLELYLSKSKEAEQEATVNEIIDDEGNIMSSDDKPSNATNSMIGSKNTWDLEKLKLSLPNSTRFYSGDFGRGFITW